MGVYFLDTSALVKAYVAEVGSGWIKALCDPLAGHVLFMSQATLAETVAAFCRKRRDGAITLLERDQLIALFRRDAQRRYGRELVTNRVYVRAGDLCRTHPLRAYDAIQLACALTVRDKMMAMLGVAPTFLSADTKLVQFASAEGLLSDNPLTHP